MQVAPVLGMDLGDDEYLVSKDKTLLVMYTKPVHIPRYQTWIVPPTADINTERYPAYHRLDIRLDRRFMFKKWNMVTFIDIMNVYARDNIWMYAYQSDGTIDNIYQFQVFPVGGITIEF